MLISELTTTIVVAIVITILAAAVGVFLLQRQSRLRDRLPIDTDYLKYIGDEKKRGMLPSVISLYGSPLRIGRYDNFEIPLDDIRVSRFHAVMVFDTESKRFVIRDQNSERGTIVNGRKLEPNEVALLRQGDRIAFGPVLYEYHEYLEQVVDTTPTKQSTELAIVDLAIVDEEREGQSSTTKNDTGMDVSSEPESLAK